ncbi:unnamed protein product [Nippostrongylus brasiliensis]|uniref:DUF3892 domain-containing protein n=1 Tax=Nippostrongylus brasiliensis TaxID=27835 RepID=A0A0N4YEE1_NIPBR|nr:unnamed protein product [Nippostrongylus brasiliensis]
MAVIQYNRHHGAREKNFNIGGLVWAHDFRGVSSSQTSAVILRPHGDRIYEVIADGQVWRRHANQLRARYIDPTATDQQLADLPLLPCSTSSEEIPPDPASTTAEKTSTSKTSPTSAKPDASTMEP